MENGPRSPDCVGRVGMLDMLRADETLKPLLRGYVISHPARNEALFTAFWVPKRKLYFRLQAWRARNRASRPPGEDRVQLVQT